MRSLLIIPLLLALSLHSRSNQTKGYVSSQQGVTIFMEGGWDSVAMQKILDDDLDFILKNIDKPPALKIFIILGAYGIHVEWRRKRAPNIFISVAFDSLSNTDTLYNDAPGIHLNSMYPGNFLPLSSSFQGTQGLKISFYDIWDTVNYYNHLLTVVDYAIRHIEEIKKSQQRICLPGEMRGQEISILTYDTARLKTIPITDWGFTIDPTKRRHNIHPLPVISVILFISILILTPHLIFRRPKNLPSRALHSNNPQ